MMQFKGARTEHNNYGVFDLSLSLGVNFADTFQKRIDYTINSNCNILAS